MLTKLRFENFKSWRDTGEIRMAPLTGFFGTNSAGKTAILQFLLMLKQTVESNDQSQILNLGSEHSYVDLGIASNIVHKNIYPTSLKFSLEWRARSQETAPVLPIWLDGQPLVKFNGFEPSFQPRITNYDQEIQLKSNLLILEDSIKVVEFAYDYRPQQNTINQLGMELINDPQENFSRYELITRGTLVENLNWSVHESEPPLQVPSPIKFYQFPNEARRVRAIGSFLGDITLAFENSLQYIYYLGPIRDYPRRFYSWSGEKTQDVGRRGENVISALLSARKQDPEIEIKIAHWLKFMGLISDFKIELIAPEQRLYQASVRIAPNGNYSPMTDVGFGVSQILPVLVLCYYVPQGSTIIFEQPEIHLHPSAQQKLADVFINIIKTRDVQIILESHSEHLLHRLQRRIAEEEFIPDEVACYFCQMEEDGASSLTPLEIDAFGNIKNWPKDFFGDEMGDLVAMTDAAMKRQMKQEAG